MQVFFIRYLYSGMGMNKLNQVFKPASFFIVLLCFSHLSQAETIKIGILTSAPIQKQVYLKYAKAFEADNPEIKLELIFKPDAEYKKDFAKWVNQGGGPDILSWQAGARLNNLIDKAQLTDLSEVYQRNNLMPTFSESAIGASSYNGKPYAVPISYYQWGFYYRESVFKALGISQPVTWDEFKQACQTLKQNGIVPITVGAKNNWPIAAWFDYLNLRINGIEFHRALLRGDHSFNDPRVLAVLKEWKALLDQGYFLEQHNIWAWLEAMPYLYHKKAGMTLIGNFFAGSMPSALIDDFKFFKFPIIDPSVEIYEEAPLDLIVVPYYTKLTTNIERVLLMFASVEFQQEFNEVSAMISPNINIAQNNNYFIQQGQATLASAKAVSQFFDRDTNEAFAAAATQILSDFVGEANIPNAISALENARLKHLK